MVDPTKDWIKVHRNLLVNELWRSEPFTRGQAWVDLLLLANHTDGYFFNRGVRIDVKRGQVGMSELQLSIRWKWSRTKVRSFFCMLEKEHQIVQHKNSVSSLITIVNYDTYQSKEQEKEQQKDNKKTLEEQQKNTNKNDKNEKNKTSSALERRRQEGFEELYSDYPRKEGKKEALRHYNASVKTLEDMVKIDLALAEYQKLVKGKERQYIKQASSWFNNWQDYVPNDWEPAYHEAKSAWEAENEDNEREEDGRGADD